MTGEIFNLTWKNYEKCTINSFKELMGQAEFVDVTLVAEDGKQVKAHKVVLSACSSVLKNILVTNPHQHPLIYLTGLKYQELPSMINFMYLGQAEVAQDYLERFMAAATKLKVKGLFGESASMNNEPVEDITITNDDYDHFEESEGELQNTSNSVSNGNIKQEDHIENYYPEPIPLQYSLVDDWGSQMDTAKHDREYKCDQCDYVAKQKSHLKPHIKAKHEGVIYHCDMCDYKANYPSNLNAHKRKKHSMNQ